MFKIIFVVYGIPLILTLCVFGFGAWILYKIWTANPYEVEKVRQLKHTVKLANAGVPNAVLECEADTRIRKGIRYVGGQIIAHYSVLSWVTMRVFNL